MWHILVGLGIVIVAGIAAIFAMVLHAVGVDARRQRGKWAE